MDHSRGIRQERQTSRLCWLLAHFSRDFAMHGLFDFTTDTGPDAPGPLTLTHGYVLDHGTPQVPTAFRNRVVRGQVSRRPRRL